MRCRQSRKRHGSQQLVCVRCNWCRDGGSCGEGHTSELNGTGEFSCTTRENEVYIGYDSGVTNPVSPRGPDKIRGPGGISDGAWDTEAATIRQLNPLTDEVYSGISGRITA